MDYEDTSSGHNKIRGGRDSSPVLNAALHFAQFWDGRAIDVEEQVLGPLFNPIYQKLGLLEDYTIKDKGRFLITKDPNDEYYFKVPSLRNVKKTSHYFHDGHVKSMEEAVNVMGRYNPKGKSTFGPLNRNKGSHFKINNFQLVLGEILKKKLIVCISFVFFSIIQKGHAIYLEPLKESLNYMKNASWMQFQERNNLYYAGIGAPSLVIALNNDTSHSNRLKDRKTPRVAKTLSNLSVPLNFPFAYAGLFWWGNKKENSRLEQFSKETFSTLYLALLESSVISIFPFHERPDKKNLTISEKIFRGQSSFPSGHVVPYAVLFFKTLQFYGPAWSSLALTLTAFVSYERISEQKHYLSDVLGSFFISAFASEGVRAAAGYEGNHSFYKKYFEHNVFLGLTRYKNTTGPRVSLYF